MKLTLALRLPIILLVIVPTAQLYLPQIQSSVADAEGTKLTDPHEVEKWIDNFVADYSGNSSVPPISFVLVKDGEVFLRKGYGYVDHENTTPVTPEQTLFRAASVSKLVTATAVMQLAKRGQLKLSENISAYLRRFQLEEKSLVKILVPKLNLKNLFRLKTED